MPKKKYRVTLSDAQRAQLEDLTGGGSVKVRLYKRARVLLLADESHPDGGKTDAVIAEYVDVSSPTVARIRRRFVEEGLDRALYDKPRSGAPKQFTGKQRAEITALACSEPPDGYECWSLRLLADQLVELGIVDSISHDTVGRVLKKTISSRISNDNGVLAN